MNCLLTALFTLLCAPANYRIARNAHWSRWGSLRSAFWGAFTHRFHVSTWSEWCLHTHNTYRASGLLRPLCSVRGHQWNEMFFATSCMRCGKEKHDRLWQKGYGRSPAAMGFNTSEVSKRQ